MWLRQFTHYLLKHPWHTFALIFAITFVPGLGAVGIVVAALVTLVKGVKEGALLVVAATAPFIISYAAQSSQEASLTLLVAMGVAILSNLLTWAFAVMLRRQPNWSALFQVAGLLGVLVVSVIHLAYPNVADWWGKELQTYYYQALKVGMVKTSAAAPVGSDSQLEAINQTKHYATGLMTAAILFNALLQLIVARWWQLVVFKLGSLRSELHNIRLSQLAGLLFVISLPLAYLNNPVVLDMMPVVYLLFGVAGLSLIHYGIALIQSPIRLFWLVLVYMVLFYAMPLSMVIVSMVALIDIGSDIRKRVSKI